MKKEIGKKMREIAGFFVLLVFAIIGRYLLVAEGMQPFPNFEIVMVATFLAIMLLDVRIAMLIPLLGMIGSDLLIGNPIFIGNKMNQIIAFTYSGFALVALITIFGKNRLKPIFSKINGKSALCAGCMGASLVLIYDVWTNLGWWYLLYPHNLHSLVTVYSLGLPFMLYHLIAGVTTFVFIGLPIVAYCSHGYESSIKIRKRTYQKVPAVVLASFLALISFTGTSFEIPKNGELWIEPPADSRTVRIKIMGDGWTMDYNISASNDTVYSILMRCSSEYNFTVEFTYWESYDAVVIDSINGDVNGEGGKYWQYYVNGIYSMESCDKQKVSNGDFIEWNFEEFG